MKIDTHKKAGPTKIALSILGRFNEAMRRELVRAKCKVRGEILEETFIFFDSPRQEKGKTQDQIYFMIFARQIRKNQYWLKI